jgi:hypothetical protein
MANDPVPYRHQNPIGGTPAVPRVGGSAFTVFHWMGQVIGFAQTTGHQSPQPVAAPVAIQPLDQRYPMQIITPAAIGPGTLQLAMYEMYGEKVWDRIMATLDAADPNGFNKSPDGFYNDLAEVFMRLANVSPINGGIKCTKVIYPPNAAYGDGNGNSYAGTSRAYAETYYNCKITDIRDDEQVDVSTMEITKAVTIQYTKMIRTPDRTGLSGAYSTILP